MSADWVDVYPLDECTAIYLKELESLYLAATLAQASTRNARHWAGASMTMASANCERAPVSYPALGFALYHLSTSPTGLVSLAAGTQDLAESLSTARAIYAEAEWTLARAMDEYAARAGTAGSWRAPFGKEISDAAQVSAMALILLRRLQRGGEDSGAVGLQGDVRELSARLRDLLREGPWDLDVETRDGTQSLADRGPVQGAALLLLAWADLALLAQSVRVWQVPAVGAPTDEMDTAVIDAISGIPRALEWIKETRTLSDETGRISIVSHPLGDGTHAWTVLIPGTQSLMGGANPQDWESNLELTAGLSSELMAAVLAAMRGAPIRPGDPVTLIGHSQGGLVGAAIAANPEVRAEFNVEVVVTVGSPVGQFDAVPDDVLALHLEDINDIVPAVDGLANTPSERHVTLVFDPATVAEDPHGHDNYAALVERVQEQGNSPHLDRLAEEIAVISGWRERGDARLYTYEFERVSTSPRLGEILGSKALEAIR